MGGGRTPVEPAIGSTMTAEQCQEFLNKWLIGHIMTHDLRFGKWYRDHHGTDAPEVTARPVKKVGWFDRLLGRG